MSTERRSSATNGEADAKIITEPENTNAVTCKESGIQFCRFTPGDPVCKRLDSLSPLQELGRSGRRTLVIGHDGPTGDETEVDPSWRDSKYGIRVGIRLNPVVHRRVFESGRADTQVRALETVPDPGEETESHQRNGHMVVGAGTWTARRGAAATGPERNQESGPGCQADTRRYGPCDRRDQNRDGAQRDGAMREAARSPSQCTDLRGDGGSRQDGEHDHDRPEPPRCEEHCGLRQARVANEERDKNHDRHERDGRDSTGRVAGRRRTAPIPPATTMPANRLPWTNPQVRGS